MSRTPFGVVAVICASALAVAAASTVLSPRALAQDPGGGFAQLASMPRVTGEVTAVAGDTLTVKDEQGATRSIVTTTNTRMMRGMGVPIKIADFKPGDGVVAVGQLDAATNTLHAVFVMATDAAQMKAMRENLGKTYIAGKVTAIDVDNLKMTVQRPDNVSQTIGFDETTSFHRGKGGRRSGAGLAGAGGAAPAAPPAGESITLADIKVGDQVAGPGSLKNGTFVPTQMVVTAPGEHTHTHGDGAATAPAAPAAQPK